MRIVAAYGKDSPADNTRAIYAGIEHSSIRGLDRRGVPLLLRALHLRAPRAIVDNIRVVILRTRIGQVFATDQAREAGVEIWLSIVHIVAKIALPG